MRACTCASAGCAPPTCARWPAPLPRGELPDRDDFKAYGEDVDARMRAWRIALAESRSLADEFERLVASSSVDAEPLP